MAIKTNTIQIGSRVRINSDVKLFGRTFTKGHEFTVFDSGPRGWDLIDDEGNKLLETGLMNDKIELVEEEPKEDVKVAKKQFLTIRVGYEGISELLKLYDKEEDGVDFIRNKRKLHSEIISFIESRIKENGLEDRDDYLDNLFNQDVEKKLFPYKDFMEVMYPTDDYCLQEWNGETFECICKKHNLSDRQILY
jgi:hypothetical protein